MSVHDAACDTGLFLIRPALFENGTDGQSEWTKDDRREQADVLKDFGLNFFYFVLFFSYVDVHWKYILHAFHWATHTHLDYRHYFACVCVRAPQHANGSARC